MSLIKKYKYSSLLCFILFFLITGILISKTTGKSHKYKSHGPPGHVPVPKLDKVNPAGIIRGSGGARIVGAAPGPGSVTSKISGAPGHGGGASKISGVPGHGGKPGPFGPANNKAVGPKKFQPPEHIGRVPGRGILNSHRQADTKGQQFISDGENVYVVHPSSTIQVRVSAGNLRVSNDNAKGGARNEGKIIFASGDIFSNAIGTESLAGSVETMGGKGENPAHGTDYDKKIDVNPGGGNLKGKWAEGNQGQGYGNNWTGNQGKGIGAGMAAPRETDGGEPGNDEQGDEDPGDGDPGNGEPGDDDPGNGVPGDDEPGDGEPGNPDEPSPEEGLDSLPASRAAPLARRDNVENKGCPALLKAVALELDIPAGDIQISIQRALASNPDIQPCRTCARIVRYASILSGPRYQERINAVREVLNELAPPERPFTPEMSAALVTALKNLKDNEEDSQYDLAFQYIDALRGYVSVLENELGSPVGDSLDFVVQKYCGELIENDTFAAFISMHPVNPEEGSEKSTR